jgi:ring-1,2-phenylacetyl-CoA epoxidase subunit PaaE
MRLCTYTLQEEDVPKENIRRENFIIEKKLPPKAVPPDTETHFVTIEQGEARYHFPSAYPDTILQSAKKQGIELPYSCETGRCGNCAARCTGGKVWLSYNEVLTEKDLAEGLTLTCVGYPVGGDVLLQL